MDLEDTEVFEITDFTNVTEWETFISKLEEIFTNIENSIMSNEEQLYDIVETVKYQNFIFNVGLYVTKVLSVDHSLLNEENSIYNQSDTLIIKKKIDCESEFSHEIDWNLAKWFGRSKFIVIVPSREIFVYGYEDVKLLLNSVIIAVSNNKCQLPILIKHGSKNWPIYEGVLIENGFKILLQSNAVKYTPKQCSNLSGIRRVFQERLSKRSILDDDIFLTAKYQYNIENNSHKNPRYFSGFISKIKEMHFFQYFSLGFSVDPIKEIIFSCYWPKVKKEILTHSNLTHLQFSTANTWFISRETGGSYDGVMYRSLRKLLKAFLILQRPVDILEDKTLHNLDSLHINKALMKLTESPISKKLFNNPVGSQKHSISANKNTILDDRLVQEILLFLFPDASNTSNKFKYPYSYSDKLNLPHYEKIKKKFPQTNIEVSLFHRISVCLANLLNQQKEGLKCLSFIWMEIVLELRYRFENGIPLPGTRFSDDYITLNQKNCSENKDELFAKLLEATAPHMSCGTSQIEQRINLVNYCILARLRNEYIASQEQEELSTDVDNAGDTGGGGGGWEDEVNETELFDEFFECTDDDSNANAEPRGRLRELKDLRQLNNPDISLYVPITQVLPVGIVTKAGSTIIDDRQSTASLQSDMSAFKAANPGCCMEDFIRWYSPRDFIEESNNSSAAVMGELSKRMKVADNIWLKTWDTTPALPARLQKRLFDDTVVAESALQWLQKMSSAEIASNIMSNVLVDYLSAMVDCLDEQDCSELTDHVDEVARCLLDFMDKFDMIDITGEELQYYQSFDELINKFQKAEYYLAVRTSLKRKFGDENEYEECSKEINELIQKLIMGGKEVSLQKQTMGRRTMDYIQSRLADIYKCFNFGKMEETESDKIFDTPNQQEYVLSIESSLPSTTSRKALQRLYICSNDDEFRMASVLSEDATFF